MVGGTERDMPEARRAGTVFFLDLNKKGPSTNGLIKKKAVFTRQNKKRKIIAQMTKREEHLCGQDLQCALRKSHWDLGDAG